MQQLTAPQSSQSGESVQLICNSSGHPITSIIWKKDALLLNATNISYQSINSNAIQLNNIGINERGYYQCFVGNQFETVSDSLFLSSNGK